jgi:uncharacterized protein
MAMLLSASPALAILQPKPKVPAPPASRHMLFRVQAPNGGTIFLLGSVHLLTPEAGALPPAVDSVFEHATTIAFETSLDSLQRRAMEMIAKARYTNGATLKSSLSPASAARLDTVLHAYGITEAQVDGFKPWFVSLLLTQSVMQRAKFETQYGVDMQLNARAHSANKPIVGLESVDVQLGMFDAVSPADQERMVLESVGPDSSARMLMKIKDAWLSGDVAGMDRLLNEGLKDSPGLFAALVTNRNAAWIPKIEALMKSSDDALVVVGAAHLVGPQGVLAMLRAKGYVIEQM